MIKYFATYKDKFGEVETEIYSNGSDMYLTLRDIKFEGSDFEGLEGEIDKSKFDYVVYKEGIGELTNFELIITIPIDIIWNGKEINGDITTFVLTSERNKKSIVQLKLKTEFGVFTNEKEYGCFEYALIGIQKKLPKNAKIKTCLSCKYSNYHPVGNGMFGSLNCFRNLKEDVEKVCNKTDLMNMWDKGIKNNKSFNVQEIFVCDYHKFVTQNDWVYKNWIQ